jgi:hypothetical protein
MRAGDLISQAAGRTSRQGRRPPSSFLIFLSQGQTKPVVPLACH